MEEHISILIADLSGYTAVTETHGAGAAADLIDQYLRIVQDSLVGDARLHERTGDEVMIVCPSPDQLADTAIMLLTNTHNTQNFLQLHGGLHCGKVLVRNNHFFGTAVNISARIAKSAAPGTFLCSSDFYDRLSADRKSLFIVSEKRSFKNVSGETETFLLHPQSRTHYHIDPVCKMLVDETAIPHPTEPNLFFCSKGCLSIYMESKTS